MNIPGNRRVSLAELATIDADAGTDVWVDGVGKYVAVPRDQKASNAIDGPADALTPISWQPDGLLAVTPAGTVAVSGMQTTEPVTGGVLGGLPPYVYGRDAARLLAELRDETREIALFAFGDSRTTGLEVYAGEIWTVLRVTGSSLATNVGLDATHWTTNLKPYQPNARVASGVDPAEVINDYLLGGAIECVVSSAYTPALTNALTTRIAAGGLSRATQPLMFGRFDGKDVLGGFILLTRNEGVAAANVAVQIREGAATAIGVPGVQRSAYFSAYSAANARIKKTVTLPSSITIGTSIGVEIVSADILTVLNESITIGYASWLEVADGAGGCVVHNLAIGGLAPQDLQLEGDGAFRTANQFVESVIRDEVTLRAGRREPWLLLDIGTNNPASDTFGQHEAQLTRLIEQYRAALRMPSCKVILRNAYPSSTNLASVAYQAGPIEVSKRMPNVICVDTYGAAYAGGGYPTAVTKGWMADTIHRNAAGSSAKERMFDAIVGGGTWTHSATVG